jgi:hypothetical protein
MRYLSSNHVLLVSIFLVAHFLPCRICWGQADWTVEFSDADLLSEKEWNSSHLTVLGFRLGMSRSEAIRIGGSTKLFFDDRSCSGSFCSVYNSDGWTGVKLFFESDSISEIVVTLYEAEMSGNLGKGLIVNGLKGPTHELATSYSESSRLELLGVENERCVKPPQFPLPRVQLFESKYKYDRRGFVLEVETIDAVQVLPTSAGRLVGLVISFIPPK